MEIRIIGTPEEIESVKEHIAEKYEIYRETGLYECSKSPYKKYSKTTYEQEGQLLNRIYLDVKTKQEQDGE